MRNVAVRERVGVKEEMSKRVDRKVLKWFGHVERMGDERLTKKVYKSEVDGERPVGRPRCRWIDGVKAALDVRKIGLATARSTCRNRTEWRGVIDKIE